MQKFWNKFKFLPILSCALLGLASCDSSAPDVSPPSIRLLAHEPLPIADMICGSVEDSVFHLKGGDTMYYSIQLNDDDALSEYKIDIHHNFDCHGHGAGAAPGFAPPSQSGLTEDWTVLDIYGLEGRTAQEERALIVPESVTAGNYHYHIQVIDESGNDSPFSNFYSIKILNPSDVVAPAITVSTPSEPELSVAKGSAIRFAGQVVDNKPLAQGGNGLVFVSYTDLRSGNTFNTSIVVPFEEGMGETMDFDAEFEIPQTLVSGEYLFSVRAHDGVRNVADPVEFQVNITN